MTEALLSQLQSAAETERPELAALLRRAALAIRNVESASIDPAWSHALLNAMVDLQTVNHNEAIRYIVGEWLKTNGYLRFDGMDEESQVEGNG